jgi:hypothetical protein
LQSAFENFTGFAALRPTGELSFQPCDVGFDAPDKRLKMKRSGIAGSGV